MNPTPWGPAIERRKARPSDQRRPLASPFPPRRRTRVMGSPSLAVDFLAAACLLSIAFLLWLAS